MNISEKFEEFLSNIKIPEDKANTISKRYGNITKNLNEKYRDTNSTTSNHLQVGSYGRFTGIKNISDLDMLYIMPVSKWDTYNKKGGQYELLNDTKESLKNTYSSSDIKVDRCVVTINFSDNSHVDVQPVFEDEEQNYTYPDTYNEGSWKITKPRKEIEAMREFTGNKNKNLRMLCKMARSWKDKSGVVMKGLLIDTLAYNFLNSTDYFNDKSYSYYDEMSRDFFKFLYDQPNEQNEYCALGSNQKIKVEKSFKRKAKKAYDLACEAIDSEKDKEKHQKWRDIYGKEFPAYTEVLNEAKAMNSNYNNTEMFIEDLYKVDIRYNLEIDCKVKQDGFREKLLREMLREKIPLLTSRRLEFYIKTIDVPSPYEIKWKVINRGDEAIRRNCERGEIVNDLGNRIKIENTNFKGEHYVECYIIKDNIVVARDFIDVPIR